MLQRRKSFFFLFVTEVVFKAWLRQRIALMNDTLDHRLPFLPWHLLLDKREGSRQVYDHGKRNLIPVRNFSSQWFLTTHARTTTNASEAISKFGWNHQNFLFRGRLEADNPQHSRKTVDWNLMTDLMLLQKALTQQTVYVRNNSSVSQTITVEILLN